MASNTGSSSPGDLLMIWRISEGSVAPGPRRARGHALRVALSARQSRPDASWHVVSPSLLANEPESVVGFPPLRQTRHPIGTVPVAGCHPPPGPIAALPHSKRL